MNEELHSTSDSWDAGLIPLSITVPESISMTEDANDTCEASAVKGEVPVAYGELESPHDQLKQVTIDSAETVATTSLLDQSGYALLETGGGYSLLLFRVLKVNCLSAKLNVL